MDLEPESLKNIRAALLEGIVTRRGHRPSAAERARVHARYRELREQHFGPVPAGERLGGPRASLSEESPLARRIFSGPQ